MAASGPALRVLLLADTHLGFDLPLRPRVDRPRRGPDFFANTRRALSPALQGEADLVVHGGDLLYRSRVPAALVARALEPLLEVADRGVPVVLVPGNHERSALPRPLLAAHAHLHVLDRPRTLRIPWAGGTVAVVGFPCLREDPRGRFRETLAAADDGAPAEVRLLCLHQTVEGARVGPSGYTFRAGPDIVPGAALPSNVAAVLAGHIHRHQVLTADLRGRPLPAPVLYPGSVERTSAAERDEAKGYLQLTLTPDPATGGRLVGWSFAPLPTRPWHELALSLRGLAPPELAEALRGRLAALPPNALVRLRLDGPVPPEHRPLLSAASLRALAGRDRIVELPRPPHPGARPEDTLPD